MIVRRGKTSKAVSELVLSLRKVMSPLTALRLKEKRNSVKDLVHGGLALGVTHLVLVSEKSKAKLRIARTPNGPTTHFDVESFRLPRSIRGEQKRPYDTTFAYATSPLVVMAGFSDATRPEDKLVRATFENMFPAFDVATVKLAECRRVLLVAKTDDGYELRHYAVRATPTGVSKPVRNVVRAANIPDLGRLRTVDEYLTSSAYPPSDSEDEEEVQLPGKFVGRGNLKDRKSAVKLAELGPRLTLRLTQVEKGLCDGDVLFQREQNQQDDDIQDDDDDVLMQDDDDDDDYQEEDHSRADTPLAGENATGSTNQKPKKKKRRTVASPRDSSKS